MIRILQLMFLSQFIFAQSGLTQIKHKADSLFNTGNYFDAITEYKRLQFFDSSEDDYYTNYQIALSYKAGSKYGLAIDYFVKALTGADEQQKKQLEFEILRTNILGKNFAAAYAKIKNMKKKYTDKPTQQQLDYWYGWTLMLDAKWEAAEKVFDTNGNIELSALCKNVNEKKYDVTFAKLISYILPGAGQVYTGNYLSGSMSLAWNVLWGYLTVNAFIADRVFDGIVIGNLLWLRFYRGNLQNAEKFAVQKNINIYNNAYKFLMEKYEGEKP